MVSASSRRLVFSRAQVSDTARFQCVATNEAGVHERDFNVIVHGKKKKKDVIKTIYVWLTVTVINVIYALNARPSDTPLRVNTPLWISVIPFFLISCKLLKSSSVFFILLVPPSIRTSGPAERSVILHKSISLECISSGIPPPSLTWLKDGRPVDITLGHLKVGTWIEWILFCWMFIWHNTDIIGTCMTLTPTSSDIYTGVPQRHYICD